MDSARERAFVATSYLLGVRGDALVGADFGAEARTIARALGSPDRETRVATLAREVARIALALERSAIG